MAEDRCRRWSRVYPAATCPVAQSERFAWRTGPRRAWRRMVSAQRPMTSWCDTSKWPRN